MGAVINARWFRNTGFRPSAEFRVKLCKHGMPTMLEAYLACVVAAAQNTDDAERVNENLRQIEAALSKTRANIRAEVARAKNQLT